MVLKKSNEKRLTYLVFQRNRKKRTTKFCDIFPLLLTVCTVVKSKVEILQNFVAFSEYMNFKGSSMAKCHKLAGPPLPWCLKKCSALFEKTKNSWTNRDQTEIIGNRIIQEKWPFFRVTYKSRCIRTTSKIRGV